MQTPNHPAGVPASVNVRPILSTPVTIINFDMPFWSIVALMIKVAIASIPAIIALIFIFAIFFAIFGGILAGIFGGIFR